MSGIIMYPKTALKAKQLLRIGGSVALKTAAIDAVTDIFNDEEIGGKPTNIGHDRKLLTDYLDREDRYRRLSGDYGDYAYFDTLTDAIIKIMPNDTVTIYSQETGNVSTTNVQRCYDLIRSLKSIDDD